MQKKSKYEGRAFVRTAQEYRTNAANHNVRRWNWIAEAGSNGRTFSEINTPNSIYRQCILRVSYRGNESSINQDLNYDIRTGWLRLR